MVIVQMKELYYSSDCQSQLSRYLRAARDDQFEPFVLRGVPFSADVFAPTPESPFARATLLVHTSSTTSNGTPTVTTTEMSGLEFTNTCRPVSAGHSGPVLSWRDAPVPPEWLASIRSFTAIPLLDQIFPGGEDDFLSSLPHVGHALLGSPRSRLKLDAVQTWDTVFGYGGAEGTLTPMHQESLATESVWCCPYAADTNTFVEVHVSSTVDAVNLHEELCWAKGTSPGSAHSARKPLYTNSRYISSGVLEKLSSKVYVVQQRAGDVVFQPSSAWSQQLTTTLIRKRGEASWPALPVEERTVLINTVSTVAELFLRILVAEWLPGHSYVLDEVQEVYGEGEGEDEVVLVKADEDTLCPPERLAEDYDDAAKYLHSISHDDAPEIVRLRFPPVVDDWAVPPSGQYCLVNASSLRLLGTLWRRAQCPTDPTIFYANNTPLPREAGLQKRYTPPDHTVFPDSPPLFQQGEWQRRAYVLFRYDDERGSVVPGLELGLFDVSDNSLR
ncbi:hypothetical protein CALCODRAFT_508762 [Calocera cornea HHB12733]|uniref:JmjC domain-containing protein n=1 Tax=Calocera cornea HHB12733 TaxID=1353952 RepID=A0A165G3R2_9BASI|nr:hypothetical protein CALCODRAFT_508762 [Calocera cornea HHB12733]